MTTFGKLTKYEWAWRSIGGETRLTTNGGGCRMVLMASREGYLETCGDDGILHKVTGKEPHLQAVARSNELLAALKAMVSDCVALEGRMSTVTRALDLIEDIETGETK